MSHEDPKEDQTVQNERREGNKPKRRWLSKDGSEDMFSLTRDGMIARGRGLWIAGFCLAAIVLLILFGFLDAGQILWRN